MASPSPPPTAPALPYPGLPADPRLAPIGVFDSGVGGLSVLREIRRLLPAEALIYAADSGHAPYGDKPPQVVQARAEHILDQFRHAGCKAAVVACNTVTGLSIQALRARYPGWPIVAIEPAVKPAAQRTRSGVVGVLATRNTVASPGLARLIATYAAHVRVLAQACSGWVERVERGELDGPETEAAVAAYVRPLCEAGADVLVLGCTHYPFLRPVIERVAGPGVTVLDPAPAVARELARRLDERGNAAPGPAAADVTFWTSADPQQTAAVITRLWGQRVRPQRLPDRA
ncbi:glutamate racemase [Tepidimonas charontis]|uniref:Glutamate racemase n=1 Tax=Tepidimonas charontis TaxID=2267262 RepID=A0A554XHR7_9BURK|nr:glutamate racemase [Tepidimonas charontis]TSE35381.1 Glutamate racemase [Tepidimonas charontis]